MVTDVAVAMGEGSITGDIKPVGLYVSDKPIMFIMHV